MPSSKHYEALLSVAAPSFDKSIDRNAMENQNHIYKFSEILQVSETSGKKWKKKQNNLNTRGYLSYRLRR